MNKRPRDRTHPYQVLNTEHVPSRVLMSADSSGGIWTYALELIHALSAHNVEVALATTGTPLSLEQRTELRRMSNVEVVESRFKLDVMEDAWQQDIERAGAWLLGLEQRLRPDIVHLNDYFHGALPWHAPKLVVAHSCALSRWTAVENESAPAAWNHYRESVTLGLQAADMIVAPTQTMLASLKKYYGVPVRGRVIHHGRDATLFTPGDKEQLILMAGRLWDKAKNAAVLAEIAPRLPWPVFMVGQSSHARHGTLRSGSARLLGRLAPKALAPWYARAAIYVLPASHEPFGYSILEAGLSGCALVLGDIPCLREIWRDAAVFVKPGDALALKIALLDLTADTARRLELAERARHRALELSPQRMAVGYLAAYSDLMKKAAQGEVPQEHSA